MRSIITVITSVLTFSTALVSAQQDSCVQTLPTGHIQVSDRLEIGGGSKDYALCAGARAKVVSGMHRFYVQEGAVLEIVGGSPQVYAQRGSTVVITGGTPRIDYAEPNVVENEGRPGQSVSHLCEVIIETDDSASCFYIPPVLIDSSLLLPQVDTLALMAELMLDSSLHLVKKRNGLGRGVVSESLRTERVKIPNSVDILHQDTLVEAMKRPLMITRGEMTINGDRNKLYVRSESVVTLRGGMNTVYLLSGSALHIEGDQENTIYFERGALVTIEGDGRAFKLVECGGIEFE